MKKNLLFFFLVISLKCLAQDFKKQVSSFFWDTDVTMRDSTLVEEFQKKGNLKFNQLTASQSGSKAKYYYFDFDKHPLFRFEIFKGGLVVGTKSIAGQTKIHSIILQVFSASKGKLGSTFNDLITTLDKGGALKSEEEAKGFTKRTIKYLDNNSNLKISLALNDSPPSINLGYSYVTISLSYQD